MMHTVVDSTIPKWPVTLRARSQASLDQSDPHATSQLVNERNRGSRKWVPAMLGTERDPYESGVFSWGSLGDTKVRHD